MNSLRKKIPSTYKSYTYLLFITLVAGFIFNILAIAIMKPVYWYDEMVLSLVSKQPLTLLLDTVLAEPHPPLIYLLLKLIPIHNLVFSKIIFIFIGYMVTTIGLIYGIKSGVIKKFNLSLGMALFISSTSFFTITSDIKQDGLTFPLLLIAFFAVLNYISPTPRRNRHQHLLILLICSTLTLFLGYIAYFHTLLFIATLVFITLYHKTFDKNFIFMLSIYFIFISSFFLLYGSQQLLNNSGRFYWTKQYANNIFSALGMHLTGYPPQHLFIDIPIILFICLLIYHFCKGRADKRTILIGFFLISYIALAYLFRFYVRPRYSLFLFFIASLLVGKELSTLKIHKYIAPSLIVLYFLYGLGGHLGILSNRKTTYSHLINKISSLTTDKKYGYLNNEGPSALVLKLFYFRDNDNLIPLHILNPKLYTPNIEKSHLLLDGEIINLSAEQIRENLKSSDLRNFIYALIQKDKGLSLDPTLSTINILNNSCKIKEITPLGSDYIFVYNDCTF